MDFTALAPRPDPAPLSGSLMLTHQPGGVSGSAETARPVLAPSKPEAVNSPPPQGFQPLDTFEVGDNDHVPVPPEPPRKATVLAVIAEAPEAPASTPPLTQSLHAIESGPDNPTVDIRR